MREFLFILRQRNQLLCYLGWVCLFLGIAAWLVQWTDNGYVWIRPARFLLSTWLFAWTMGWLLHYLRPFTSIRLFSYVLTALLVFENVYTVFFAVYMTSTGEPVPPATDNAIINAMASGVAVITIWCAYFTYLFFTRHIEGLRMHYLWGIRFGMLFFVLFALSGNLLAALPGWTVGARDGSSGLPFVNWGSDNRVLRIAHFLGLHALQVLPLFGYYVSRRSFFTIVFSIVYFLVVIAVFTQALLSRPLIELYFG